MSFCLKRKRVIKPVKLVLVIAAAISAQCPTAGSTNTAFDDGLQFYSQGQFDQSIVCFTRASIAQPTDPLVHYYLANAYSRLGKHAEAKQQYFACYCLDPTGKTASYCRAALRAYGDPVPGDKESKNVGPGSKTGSNANEVKQIIRAVSQIHRQAQLEKNSKNAIANQGALTAGRIGEEEATRIRNAAYRRIYNRPLYLTPYDFFARDTESADSIMSRADEGARLARLAAKKKADKYESWSRDQEQAVDDIAANLESQLKSGKRKGGAHLRPEGTGFYVRFYGQERAQPLPNVHGSVARISPFGSDQPIDELQTQKSVKGEVVK